MRKVAKLRKAKTPIYGRWVEFMYLFVFWAIVFSFHRVL